jgi:uncharacterized protein (TIGR02300 family)
VAKPDLGTKRLCGGCGAKFYDLDKDPIACPKCGTVFELTPAAARARAEPVAARAAKPEEVEVVPETKEAEFVSLEEADAEAEGAKVPAAAAEGEDVEVEDAPIDDAAFIVPEEEEEDDVTDIIGGEIEDEEES